MRPSRVEDRRGPAGKTLLDDRDVVAELPGHHAGPADMAREAIAARGVESPRVRVAETEDSRNHQMLIEPRPIPMTGAAEFAPMRFPDGYRVELIEHRGA